MRPANKLPAAVRGGDLLRIGREAISFARHILVHTGSAYSVQHRLFVNDPWELIAEAIARAVGPGRTSDIAQSFRRQAEDYFRAATIGRELAVRPVLLYYAFLNLSKAYGIAKGNTALAGRTSHGISPRARGRSIPGSLIKFDTRKGKGVFQELLRRLDGNPAVVNTDLRLGHLMPQILSGHRLWCYATNGEERFLTIESFDVRHLPSKKEVWLNLYLNRKDLELLGTSETKALRHTGFHGDFDIATTSICDDWVCFQQRNPAPYTADPAEALAQIIRMVRNRIWETVRVVSPYRKPYVYCGPPAEQGARLPQLLSMYLLMFFLGSVTRYSPGYFEYLLESRYGPFFETFISECPTQFLFLMASEILGREVSKPAII